MSDVSSIFLLDRSYCADMRFLWAAHAVRNRRSRCEAGFGAPEKEVYCIRFPGRKVVMRRA
jgi:hypothetical protein